MTDSSETVASLLPHRAVLALTGADTESFLQGLVSNDVEKLTAEHALYAALLTPQGKFLHDLIMVRRGDAVLIDCEAARRADLQRRLTIYRLRAKVTIAPADDLVVAVAFGPGAAGAFGLGPVAGATKVLDSGVAVFVDPRLADLGLRLIGPREAVVAALAGVGLTLSEGGEAYDRHRLLLGVPDGSRDIAVDRGFLLENNFEELNGVSFTKGCYVGQELTARTKHRANIRKRLYTVRFDPAAEPPAPDTPILLGGKEVGAMRTAVPGIGLAVLRLDDLQEREGDAHVFTAGELVVEPVRPSFLAD